MLCAAEGLGLGFGGTYNEFKVCRFMVERWHVLRNELGIWVRDFKIRAESRCKNYGKIAGFSARRLRPSNSLGLGKGKAFIKVGILVLHGFHPVSIQSKDKIPGLRLHVPVWGSDAYLNVYGRCNPFLHTPGKLQYRSPTYNPTYSH